MKRRLEIATLLVVGVCAWPAHAQSPQLEEAVGLLTEGNRKSAESQRRVEQLGDETEAMAAEYRSLLDQIDDLETYVRQVDELSLAQEDEIANLRREIDAVEVVGRGIPALMARMVEALETFVALDLPFLQEERKARVLELRKMLARSDVTDAEKFRRILEAYQIENEYGRTIEAYRGTLEGDGAGQGRTVDFLRVGRIALVYQTNDASEVGAWSREAGRWIPLDDSYRSAVRDGLRIALKQSAPDLIRIPLPQPVGADGNGGGL